MPEVTVICASTQPRSLRKNLLASDLIDHVQLIVQQDYTNVARAYNQAWRVAEGDVLLFVHQDVFLPTSFESQLRCALHELDGKSWGVLGPAGQAEQGGLGRVLDRGFWWGDDQNLPAAVSTIDELLLVVRNTLTIRFDEQFPQHLLGADLCLQAQAVGLQNYAIHAVCHHHSATRGTPEAFWPAAMSLMKKWQPYLPIYTTPADLIDLDNVQARK